MPHANPDPTPSDLMSSFPLRAAKTALLVSSLFLTSCQAVVNESGSIIEPEKAAQIQIGTTTRDEVLKLLGPPTLVNTFRQERWIYIQDRQFKNIQRTFSRVTNRIEITFDGSGFVRDVQRNFKDALYDPREISKQKEDRGYSGWLLDGKFARPANNPGPIEPENKSGSESTIWPDFLKKGSTAAENSEKKSGNESQTPVDPEKTSRESPGNTPEDHPEDLSQGALQLDKNTPDFPTPRRLSLPPLGGVPPGDIDLPENEKAPPATPQGENEEKPVATQKQENNASDPKSPWWKIWSR